MQERVSAVATQKEASGKKVLLSVKNLVKHFEVGGGFMRKALTVRAVDGVSLEVREGETFGLVGESGCGKTTLGQTIVRLYKPTAGELKFEGQDISKLSDRQLRPIRQSMQMVFQDPYSSLDPRMTVGSIIAEPLEVFNYGGGKEARSERVKELLKVVGLNAYFVNRYPHEFSGGQRQRIGIARSLALQPKLIVCDEPVSALDVSIQAQILNLLRDLQRQYGLAYLFIAHNLAVVSHISDRIGVMYLGRIVEVGDAQELVGSPMHPYTKALLSAIAVPDRHYRKQRLVLTGDVPSPVNPPSGCRFHTRCPIAVSECSVTDPELRSAGGSRIVACHLA